MNYLQEKGMGKGYLAGKKKREGKKITPRGRERG